MLNEGYKVEKQKAVFQLHINEYPIKDWIFRKEVRLKNKDLFFQLQINEYPIKDWIFRKEVRLKKQRAVFSTID